MATISNESLAQFWLHAFPYSSEHQDLTFSDSTIVDNLLNFEEKKIFDIIHGYIQQIKPQKIIKTIPVKIVSPKRRRSTKLDAHRLKFTINIEVFDVIESEEIPTENFERTIDNLSSILHQTDTNLISQYFHQLIYPWLIDISFTISNDIFTLIIELMNKYSKEFFLQCFLPWLNQTSIENLNLFCSNLFTQLKQLSDQCQLCIYLCENSTIPLNNPQLGILNQWFDSKEFYFSNDLFNLLPEKILSSAEIYSDNLFFAKLLHKILIKYTENNVNFTHEQRMIFKKAIEINTTMLSDILLDLLE